MSQKCICAHVPSMHTRKFTDFSWKTWNFHKYAHCSFLWNFYVCRLIMQFSWIMEKFLDYVCQKYNGNQGHGEGYSVTLFTALGNFRKNSLDSRKWKYLKVWSTYILFRKACSLNFSYFLSTLLAYKLSCNKVHISWEGHKILRNLHLTLDWD